MGSVWVGGGGAGVEWGGLHVLQPVSTAPKQASKPGNKNPPAHPPERVRKVWYSSFSLMAWSRR